MEIAILVKTISQYQVLDAFALGLKTGLIEEGVFCGLYQSDQEIFQLIENPKGITLQFNGALQDDTTKKCICDYTKRPHFVFCVDPFYRFWNLLSHPYMHLILDDRHAFNWLQKKGIERICFLPHAVDPFLKTEPLVEKCFDIVYLASWIDVEKVQKEWKRKFSKKIAFWMEDIVQAVLEDPTLFYVDLFWENYPSIHKFVKEKAFDGEDLLIEIELVLKGVLRLKLLSALAPLPIHVFGAQALTFPWETYLKKSAKHLHLHGPLSYLQAIEVMKQSKIVLNSGLPCKDGAHERVFTAPLCGALPLTQQTPYLKEDFEDQISLLFYQLGHLDSLKDKILFYLNEESARLQVVSKGASIILEKHTWKQRAKTLISFVKSMNVV